MSLLLKISFILAIVGTLQAQSDKKSQYAFDYAVQDQQSGVQFHQQEQRDRNRTDGTYQVLLPDTRLMKVAYFVDGNSGYVAQITYEGEAQFPDATGSGTTDSSGTSVSSGASQRQGNFPQTNNGQLGGNFNPQNHQGRQGSVSTQTGQPGTFFGANDQGGQQGAFNGGNTQGRFFGGNSPATNQPGGFSNLQGSQGQQNGFNDGNYQGQQGGNFQGLPQRQQRGIKQNLLENLVTANEESFYSKILN